MPTSRELLWRFGIDTSDAKSAIRDISGLLSKIGDDQDKDREEERKALDDYSNSVKAIASQLGILSDQTDRQVEAAKNIANSYRELLALVQARLDQEAQIADQMDRQKQSTIGGPQPTRTTVSAPGASPLPRSTPRTAATQQPSSQSVPEWMTATAKLRADVAQEAVGTAQVATERQRIVGLIDVELAALKQKDSLSKGELTSLKQLTLERERQSDALAHGTKIGVTAGTQEAASRFGGGGALLQDLGSIGGAALGGQAGGLMQAVIGGATGGGIVELFHGATEALAGFVAEIRSLIDESDRTANVQASFGKLAQSIGALPTGFLNNLKEATHGLVDSTVLMTDANRVMLQGLPLTTEQITKLIGSVTTLARLQGKDATAAFDDVTRALSSSRLSMLAYRVGLDETAKVELQRAQGFPESTRLMQEYNIIMNASERQVGRMGNAQETLGTKLEQAHVKFGDFLTDLSLAISESSGMETLGDAMLKLADSLTKNIPTIVDDFGKFATALGNVVDLYEKYTGLLDKAGANRMGPIILPGAKTEQQSALTSDQARGLREHPFWTKEFWTEEGSPTAGPAPPKAPSPPAMATEKTAPTPITPITQPRDFNQEKKIAEDLAQVRIQAVEQVFNAQKTALDMIKAAEQQRYAQGKTSLQDYVDFQKFTNEQEMLETIKRIDDENKLKKAGFAKDMESLTAPMSVGGQGLTGIPLAKASQDIRAKQSEQDAQAETQRQQARDKRKEEDQKVNLQTSADSFAAEQTRLQTEYDLQKSYLALDKAALEQYYKDGAVSAEDYLTQREAQIKQEYDITVQSAIDKYDATEKTEKDPADLYKTLTDASIQMDKETTASRLGALDTIMQAQESHYSKAKSLLETQLSEAAMGTAGTGGYSEQQVSIINQLITATEKKMVLDQKDLEALNEQLKPLDEHSDKYLEIQGRIEQDREALMKFNDELIKSRDMLTPTGTFFEQIGKALGGPGAPPSFQRTSEGLQSVGGLLSSLGGIFTSTQQRTAARTGAPTGAPSSLGDLATKAAQAADALKSALVDTLGAAADAAAAKLADFTAALPGGGMAPSTGGTSAPNSPGPDMPSMLPPASAPSGASAATSPIRTIISGIESLGKTSITTAQKMQNFGDAITTAVGMVGGFANVLSGKEGPVGGAISGGSMGASLGGQLGGMISALGAAGGPIGMGVGGAVGIVSGLFSGKAAQKVQAAAQQIQNTVNEIVQSINLGTTNLSEGIAQVQQQYNQAVSQLSGSKGGQQELNSILPALQQTIDQLQQKQVQLMQTMDQTSQILSAPQPFQQYLQGFQSIINAYQQYVSAGGSVAEANQYMVQSFQNLLVQDTQNLLNDQQSAIQNAINYNDLLVQQQQLVLNTNQSIENVMAQGSVTREAPTAMTKGLQIAQIQVQYQLQEQNLQEQIAVAQYGVQSQQQMFDLASTRVGLEMQLAQVQEALIAQQNVQVSGLQGTVGFLSNGAANALNVANAINSGANSAAALLAGMGAIMSMMGLGTGSGFGAQLQQLLTQMLANLPGMNQPVTLPGAFGAPVQQPVPISSFQEGGVVTQDQIAQVHAGEIVVPEQPGPSFAEAVGASLTSGMDSSAQRLANEAQILSTAQQRLQVEQQIAYMQIQVLNVLAGMLGSLPGTGPQASFLQAFMIRGQQGLGGFSSTLF